MVRVEESGDRMPDEEIWWLDQEDATVGGVNKVGEKGAVQQEVRWVRSSGRG